MPSIRGYKKGIDDKSLRDVIDKYTAHITTVAAKAGKKAMYKLRTSAVKRWYNSTAALAMNDATIYESDMPKQKNKQIEITIRSYVDIDLFEEYKKSASERNSMSSPYENLSRWRKRHEKDGWRYLGVKQPQMDDDIYKKSFPAIKMPYSIGEYLFKLPWEEGIIGLPPNARNTGTGWKNPKPIIKELSLESYLKKDLNKKWAKEVRKEFAELNK